MVFKILIMMFITVGVWSPAKAEIHIPNIFSSHMVLQCNQPIKIWGTAKANKWVHVNFAGQNIKVQSKENGQWRVQLSALPVGGPYEMTITTTLDTLILTDIMMGEVWLCSGQSNMWRPLYWPQREWGVVDYKQHISAAKEYTRIRFLNISRVPGSPHPNSPKGTPMTDANGHWQVCTPETAAYFSAVAQFFGRMLTDKLNVPVGLINASYGGSKIEAWTPPKGFQIAGLDSIAHVAKHHTPDKKLDNKTPSGLYNSMIHPLVPLSIRGAIWYQGESNLGDGARYSPKMRALILGWRDVWNRDDLPFYFVQLPPYRYGTDDPLRLPRLRKAQTAALELPNTGMAVTLDVGDLNDIHPRNKQPVGQRLARLALAKTYRQDIVCCGPTFRSMSVRAGKIHVYFNHTAGGLASRDGHPLTGFEIAGMDGRFIAADAFIDERHVIVYHPEIPDPVAIRYGWHQLSQPNLVNAAGLPAAPFFRHVKVSD